jgi:uncharacterized protein YuzE
MHETADDALDEQVVVDLQLDGEVQGVALVAEHLVELCGLVDSA